MTDTAWPFAGPPRCSWPVQGMETVCAVTTAIRLLRKVLLDCASFSLGFAGSAHCWQHCRIGGKIGPKKGGWGASAGQSKKPGGRSQGIWEH